MKYRRHKGSNSGSSAAMQFSFSDYYTQYDSGNGAGGGGFQGSGSDGSSGASVSEDPPVQASFMKRATQQFNNITQKVKGLFTSS